MKFILSLLFAAFFGVAFSQTPTIGLRLNDSVTSGYLLYSPLFTNDVFLVNECGEVVNQWAFSEQPGATVYLLEDGNLLRAGKDSLQIRSWNNQVLWTYATTDNGYKQHHDIEPLPNGNILMICRDTVTQAGAIALGRDPSITDAGFRLDYVVELQPTGTNGANLVWQWSFRDHYIQNTDNGKPNFGVPADYPELLDINYDNGVQLDFIHMNGIDYNATLDQIVMSSRSMSEIYIIDHSTTVAEAASHSGGNSGKGGDFLWRWGNPDAYGHGGIGTQKLYGQHDPQWVQDGYPDAGKISVFNNGGDGTGTASMVNIIQPEIVGGAYTMQNNEFLPQAFDWSWAGSILGDAMYQGKGSGCQVLSNGNVLIAEDTKGQVTEVNRNGQVLWVYRNPAGPTIWNQFSNPPLNQVDIFRGEKYEPGYPGLMGQNLNGNGIIEDQNSVSENCVMLGVNELPLEKLILSPNPVSDNLTILGMDITDAILYSMDGNIVYQKSDDLIQELNLSSIEIGVYLLKLCSEGNWIEQRIIKQ